MIKEKAHVVLSRRGRHDKLDTVRAKLHKEVSSPRGRPKVSSVGSKDPILCLIQFPAKFALGVETKCLRNELVATLADQSPNKKEISRKPQGLTCLDKGPRMRIITEKQRPINVQDDDPWFYHAIV